MAKRPAPRTAFKPGQSGNPGGRPAILKQVKELAREHTEDAVNALIAALLNPGERVQAATILLAYGYGRPQQNINVRRINSVDDLDEDELHAIANTPIDADSRTTKH